MLQAVTVPVPFLAMWRGLVGDGQDGNLEVTAPFTVNHEAGIVIGPAAAIALSMVAAFGADKGGDVHVNLAPMSTDYRASYRNDLLNTWRQSL